MSGDTANAIAQKLNIPAGQRDAWVQQFLALNNTTERNLQVDQVLKVPPLVGAAAAPGATPVAPPPTPTPVVTPTPTPLVLADGQYFAQLQEVDVPGATIRLIALCSGGSPLVAKELPKDQQRLAAMKVTPGATVSLYIASGGLESGRYRQGDLKALADSLKQNAAQARWWVTVQGGAISSVEQDSGIRATNLPDDPCPRVG